MRKIRRKKLAKPDIKREKGGKREERENIERRGLRRNGREAGRVEKEGRRKKEGAQGKKKIVSPQIHLQLTPSGAVTNGRSQGEGEDYKDITVLDRGTALPPSPARRPPTPLSPSS